MVRSEAKLLRDENLCEKSMRKNLCDNVHYFFDGSQNATKNHNMDQRRNDIESLSNVS